MQRRRAPNWFAGLVIGGSLLSLVAIADLAAGRVPWMIGFAIVLGLIGLVVKTEF